MLERYGHGGDLRTAEESFGLNKEEFLDFSANMNPLGPPEVIEHIMKSKWHEINRYPDPASRQLVKAISEHYEIPEASIMVGNGAAELIDLLVRHLVPNITGLAQPCFSEYGDAVHNAAGIAYDIPLYEEHSFELQESDIEQAMNETNLLFLGHPNNPTGKLIPQCILNNIINRKHPLILDEAFMDFIANEAEVSRIRQAAGEPNLYVIRSMTKFFSIPGIRLGFMVAHPDMIAQLRKRQTPWSVNFLAQEIGKSVLNIEDPCNEQYAQRTREWLDEERPWLTNQLELLGLQVVPSETNFLLISLPEQSGYDIKQLQQLLGRKGILVRDASLFKGLNERYGRVAVRTRLDNERLVQAIREVMAIKVAIKVNVQGMPE